MMKIILTLTSLILTMLALPVHAMDYGLKFNSHSVPGSRRSTLYIGKDTPIKFKDRLELTFDLAFYDRPHFGQICSLRLDNGTYVNIASAVKEDGGNNPAVIINGEMTAIPAEFIADDERPAHITLSLDKPSGTVSLKFNNTFISAKADLGNASSCTITFGRTAEQPEIAPIDIRDIRISADSSLRNHWELARHAADTTFDRIGGLPAVAENPRWILDDHFRWKKIFEFKADGYFQTTFNPGNSVFYILSDNSLKTFNAANGKTSETPLPSSGRVMRHSNHLAFDPSSNSLLSYNLDNNTSSRLSLADLSWSGGERYDKEPHFYNHSFATDGKSAYTFGGYGYYLYHNNAAKIDLASGTVTSVILDPMPEPRTSPASAIVGDKLYIFGGTGNASGQQEIPAVYYYDLWEYDLNTLKGKKLWEMEKYQGDFLPSQSMYLSPDEKAFYLASTLNDGTMIKIDPEQPGYTVVTDKMGMDMDFKDCVFDLYRSADARKYYLVVDKRVEDTAHDYAIYEVSYPFSDNPSYKDLRGLPETAGKQSPEVSATQTAWMIVIAAGAILLFAAAIALSRRNRNRKTDYSELPQEPENAKDTSDEEPESPSGSDAETDSEQSAHAGLLPPSRDDSPSDRISIFNSEKEQAHFDRTKSAISLLGEFNVRDREGNDITAKFTSRLKDLLILLVLEGEKNPKGVRQQTIDELIWKDRDEKSAKNNRNVYMRKLRLLLSETGDIEVVFDKGYYVIVNKGVLIDYFEVKKRIGQLEENESVDNAILDETLELLLYGPLLPHTTYPWLDSFKGKYSDKSLDMLFKLLKYESSHNPDDDRIIYRIAETISCHDPLSEEALEIKCRVLAKRKFAGLAKKTFEIFQKTYSDSFGEDFPKSFSEILGRKNE